MRSKRSIANYNFKRMLEKITKQENDMTDKITFPGLDTDACKTLLEVERDGIHGKSYTGALQGYFISLDYKQLCLLFKMSRDKAEECRQAAAKLVQEGLAAGTVDITKAEDYDPADSLDEFGKYIVEQGAGAPSEDHYPEVEEDLSFLLPRQNLIAFGRVPRDDEDEEYYGSGRKFLKRRKRVSRETCANLETHAWQIPEAQSLYLEAHVFGVITTRCLETLRHKFSKHHSDLGAKAVLEALSQLVKE